LSAPRGPHHQGVTFPRRITALRRQLLKVSEISAVPTSRRLVASGTQAYFRSRGRDHPAIAIPLDAKNPHARSRSPIHVSSHARLSARRPIKPTSTESEADPSKMSCDKLTDKPETITSIGMRMGPRRSVAMTCVVLRMQLPPQMAALGLASADSPHPGISDVPASNSATNLRSPQPLQLLDPLPREIAKTIGHGGGQGFHDRQNDNVRVPAGGRSDPAGENVRGLTR
jgi:hypothetical protein